MTLALALFGSTETEVKRYSIGMEVVRVEEADNTFYLRGDDKMIIAEADPRFAQGDWVEVEIQVFENPLTHTTEEHTPRSLVRWSKEVINNGLGTELCF